MSTFTVTNAIIAKTRRHLDPDYFSENKSNILSIESAVTTLTGRVSGVESAVETLQTQSMIFTGTNAALPVYADNAAALADDATVGSLYANASGAVFVVLAA